MGRVLPSCPTLWLHPFSLPSSSFHFRLHKVDGKSSNIQSKNIPAWIRKHIFCNRFNKQNICQEQMAGMKLNGEFFICFKLHKVYIGSGGDGGDPKKLRDRSWNCIIIDNKKSCQVVVVVAAENCLVFRTVRSQQKSEMMKRSP